MKNTFYVHAILLMSLSFITASRVITDGVYGIKGYISLWSILVSIASLALAIGIYICGLHRENR